MASCSASPFILGKRMCAGLALVVSCDYRALPEKEKYPVLTGTKKDANEMQKSLATLEYAITRLNNPSLSDLKEYLARMVELVTTTDSLRRLVFVFSGHGNDDSLVTNDGREIGIAEIVNDLSWSPISSQCPLVNVVRLFFIDACRGARRDSGMLVSRGAPACHSPPLIRVPKECPGNLLIGYSTTQGFQSYEKVGGGGMWMSLVAEMIVTIDDNIQGVLTSVRKKLEEKCQDLQCPYVQQGETLDRLKDHVNLYKEALQIQTLCTKRSYHNSTPPQPAPFIDGPCRNKPIAAPVNRLESSDDPVKIHPAPQTIGPSKAQLNECVQKRTICSFDWLHDEVRLDSKRMRGFKSFIQVKLQDGRKVHADSQHYYPSKNASREVAASHVLKAIQSVLKSGVSQHATQTETAPEAPSSTSKQLIYKEKLNNLLQGHYRTHIPNYNNSELGEQLFQCTISHPLFECVTGACCKSKRQAEDSAAKLAFENWPFENLIKVVT